MKLSISSFLKAIYAGAGACLTGLGTALVEAHTFANVSDASWVTIAALTLGSAGAVYGVTNSPTSTVLTSISSLAEPITAAPVVKPAPIVLPPVMGASGP